MKSALLAVAIVMVFASGAMALAFPTLTGVPAGLTTITQTASQITLATPTSPVGYGVGVGVSPVPGNDCVLSTTLHFDMTNPTELGFLARANVNTQQAYVASLNPLNGYLSLGGIVPAQQIPAAFNFDPVNKDYGLVFTVSGSSLTASVYDGTTQILTMSGSDSTLTSGLIGVIGSFPTGGGANLFGTFNNSSVNTVPEPGTVAMVAAGALALLGWAGVRRRRS